MAAYRLLNFGRLSLNVSVDIVFIPSCYGVHAFERSAFPAAATFFVFGVLYYE
jgi:hypothetical protein